MNGVVTVVRRERSVHTETLRRGMRVLMLRYSALVFRLGSFARLALAEVVNKAVDLMVNCTISFNPQP